MWVKIGNDVLNLAHVVRIRFSRAFKNGRDELLAEVDAMIKGEVQAFVRYRGPEAEYLQAMVQTKVRHNTYQPPAMQQTVEQSLGQALSSTVADMKIV